MEAVLGSKVNAKRIALVDCNNFYVSCERVFQPRLEGLPVAVLSNNDGCIIARSDEVRAMGVPMAAPYFHWRDRLREAGAVVLSANFSLYGDMSRRVMATLARFTPDFEIYSIDEAFLGLTGFGDPVDHARRIRETVQRWTGIPVSIGVSTSKTLAKMANRLAKADTDGPGVKELVPGAELDGILERFPVGDIWGVGDRLARRLKRSGIHTAKRLRDTDERWISRKLGVVGQRMVYELRGINCLPIEEAPPANQGICTSRSFAEPLTTLEGLETSVSSFIGRAAEKLRAQGLAAGAVGVFVMTSRFAEGPGYHNSTLIELPVASSITHELCAYALKGLRCIFKKGYRYKRAGVLLGNLVPAGLIQRDLFDKLGKPSGGDENLRRRGERLMETLDRINTEFGSDTLGYASGGLGKGWPTIRGCHSPRYTTSWRDLPVVRAAGPEGAR
jgi:DNA polymerase V